MDITESKQLRQENIDLDEILPKIEEFGVYQKYVIWLICLPACFPCGFCAFNQLFMVDVPDHWCKVSQLSQFDVYQRRNVSIPLINKTFETCKRYSVNWTELLQNNKQSLENINVNNSWLTENCIEGWEYDKNLIESSIVIDFNLVCGKNIYPTLGLVALNLGGPIGVFLFGKLNDSIGRKRTFFLCLSTLLLGSILTCTARNFLWWAGSRVVVGLTIPAIYQIPFIIALELVGPTYRSFVTVLTCIFYTFGLMMLSGIAYLIRNWIYLGLTTSLPFILYYFYWPYLPESPRWLLTQDRFEEALEILETLAKVNNKEIPSEVRQQFRGKMTPIVSINEESAKNLGFSDLFRTPNMRLKTIIITFSWFANQMVYVGLSYYGPSVGSDKYTSFLLSAVVEIPGYLGCWLIMDRWGRRWPLCLCMVVSGLCCIATIIVHKGNLELTLILYLISKSTISASFLIIYPFAGELYPTQLRGLGIGTSAYIAGVGLLIIPFITYLGSDDLVLPLVIMGFISVIGGIVSLRLPETLHHRLPQTVEEGEEFGKDFTTADCFQCIPLRSTPTYEDLSLVPIEMEKTETSAVKKSIHLPPDSNKPDGIMQVTYWF